MSSNYHSLGDKEAAEDSHDKEQMKAVKVDAYTGGEALFIYRITCRSRLKQIGDNRKCFVLKHVHKGDSINHISLQFLQKITSRKRSSRSLVQFLGLDRNSDFWCTNRACCGYLQMTRLGRVFGVM